MPYWLIVTFIVLGGILLLAVAVTIVANLLFENKTKKEVAELFQGTSGRSSEIISKEDLIHLPQPVQKWLENSNIIGKEKIVTVRLKQQGLMRLAMNKPWMSAKAEQYFRTDEPSFVWKATVKMAPFLSFKGLDIYKDGKGDMNIKVLSIFSVVAAKGREIDQGTILRYLGEMPWFPTAALSPYISWDAIDENSAKATMRYKGVTVSAVFQFNANGDIVSFKTKRYRELNGKYVLQDWGGLTREISEFNGIRIASKSDIFWVEDSGEFIWFQCEITDVEYNQPTMY